ncbi:MAG: hypothetical protein LBI74_09190 [Synergistaceae bacterium]|jgi:hypothetical protein|nr:hypothetical protein [Synergistaceae bacterium]
MTDYNLPEELKKYMDSVASALERGGVDALAREGILRDIASRISEMRSEERLPDTEILSRMDPPAAYLDVPTQPPSEITLQTPPKPRLAVRFWGSALNVAAVAASAIAIFIGAAFGYGNPLFGGSLAPSRLHMGLLIPVPFIIAWSATAVGRASLHRPRVTAFLNGYLIAVGLFYSIAILPLSTEFFGGIHFGRVLIYALTHPMSLMWLPIALILFLVICSPFPTFAAGCVQGLRMRRRLAMGERRSAFILWLAGAASVLAVLGGWECYRSLTDSALERAIRGTEEETRSGVAALERLGTRNAVLESCYGRSAMPKSVYFMFWRIGDRAVDLYKPAEYQALYYRMTGRDFRDERRASPQDGWQDGWRERNLAQGEIGGDAVGSSVRRLELASAALDISAASSPDGLDAGSSVAYAEMTMEFMNNGYASREARCQIILPPGGVASRLTLWIDGEERESAFGDRSDVKDAYRDVAVVRARDPALLTTAGPDRVLLQCFPVLPKKSMKVKVGFTLPLIPDGEESALVLPYFAERNFAYAPDMRVALWAESRAPISAGELSYLMEETMTPPASGGGTADEPGRAIHAVRGEIGPDSLASYALYLPSPRHDVAYRSELAGVVGYSSIAEVSPLPDRFIAVVLDTSASMAASSAADSYGLGGFDWRSALERLPDRARVALFAGGLQLPPMDRDEALLKWPDAVRLIKFEGADEQASNLEYAWDLCAGERNSAVLWIHGKLPFDISDTTGLEQRFRRRPNVGEAGSPPIFSLQTEPGANRLEEDLPGIISLVFPGIRTSGSRHLSRVLAASMYPRMRSREQIFSLQAPAGCQISEASSLAARLAYAGEIARRAASGRTITDDERERAREMRIVTAATGAVVLENAEQYEIHNLDPSSNTQSVPTIPEPEEYALMAAVCALLALAYLKRRMPRRF